MRKVGIVGFGGMGGYHCSQICEKLSEYLEVKGVFDVRKERMDYASSLGLVTYDSLEALLADEEISIVTIATPNNFHKNIAIDAMRAGKNVVCEKPVTMNAAELEEIIAVSDETGKVFTVHQNRRWDKDYCIIKKIFDDGIIGKPYMIESRVQGSKRVLQGWRGAKVNGGGMVLDWGIHILDQVMWMDKSKVKEVYADLYNIYSKEVDDNFKALIRFESGLSAMLQVDTNCFINQARWHVTAEDGTAIINDWSCKGRIIKLSDEKDLGWDDEIIYTEAGPTRTMAPRPRETTSELELPEVQTDWTDYYKNVIAAIDGSEELIVKPEEALRVMKVIEKIFESGACGKSVSCDI